MLSRKNHLYVYLYTHTTHTDTYMHLDAQDLAKQSLILHCDAMKEHTIHAILFVAFSFPYSVYFMQCTILITRT